MNLDELFPRLEDMNSPKRTAGDASLDDNKEQVIQALKKLCLQKSAHPMVNYLTNKTSPALNPVPNNTPEQRVWTIQKRPTKP